MKEGFKAGVSFGTGFWKQEAANHSIHGMYCGLLRVNNIAIKICEKVFGTAPDAVERCTVGQGNYVYIVECLQEKYVLRCNADGNTYKDTVHWLRKLKEIEIPVPKVIDFGQLDNTYYLMLSYIEGKDIGIVYACLSEGEKAQIAKQAVSIQKRAGQLQIHDLPADWKWVSCVEDMLDRAKQRILLNGYFEAERAERIKGEMTQIQDYLSQVKPVPYLDDISTKNLLIHNGKISGVIDVDWIGTGDRLTFVALTYIALLNEGYDTKYVEYILEEMQLTEKEKRAFLFYSLVYCVDFMGERGMTFMDKRVEVNEEIIARLNNIYNFLWQQWCAVKSPLSKISAEAGVCPASFGAKP